MGRREPLLELGSPSAAGAAAAVARRRLGAWHLAWAAVGAVGVAAALKLSEDPQPLLAAAFAAIAAAGLVGFVLSRREGAGAERAVLASWSLASLAAVGLSGGLEGPLPVWLLIPGLAGAAMGRTERLAAGAACAAAAVALVGAAGLAVDLPAADGLPAYGLEAAALASTALALGAALILMQRGAGLAGAGRAGEPLKALLDAQPHLILSLFPSSRVEAVYGGGDEPLGARVRSDGLLLDAVSAADRARVEDALRAAACDGAAEVEFGLGGERELWAALSLRRLADGRLVGVLRDASAAHAREQALQQARDRAESQNAGKSRFLANMSHELRTPLNAIMGFSDIMRQRLFGAIPERYGDYANLIHESGAHLLDLINDVLDMSKIEAERFELAREEFDAREAISSVLRLMRGQADRAGVQLRGVLPREPLDAIADRRALKQIALNLISNALKFTPRGGAVTVTLNSDREVLELVVADTGVGIGAEDLARLGRPYEQAGGAEQRASGTGLGLSLVRAFAELHGGEMVLESRLGEGSTVTVRMPVLELRPLPAPEGAR